MTYDFTGYQEEDAVNAIRDLALALEKLLYIAEPGIEPKAKTILNQAYKASKAVVDHYYGEDSPLSWEGPSTRTLFSKKGAK